MKIKRCVCGGGGGGGGGGEGGENIKVVYGLLYDP